MKRLVVTNDYQSDMPSVDNIEDKINNVNDKINNSHAFMTPEMQLSPGAIAILQSTPELNRTESRLDDESIYETPKINIMSAQKYREKSLDSEIGSGPKSSDIFELMNVDQSSWKEMDHLLSENKDLIDIRLGLKFYILTIFVRDFF